MTTTTTKPSPATVSPAPEAQDLLRTLRGTIIEQVASEAPDLSMRQLGVLLEVYLQDDAQTVRGLAATLNVSKPAITRALDRLGELDLARRKVDPSDRRSVLVQRTLAGTKHVHQLAEQLAKHHAKVARSPAP
ncbi:MarR family winged helix-turn-helix transcriptional regulator [Falsiroseomonas tokyonensis]|uniref:MarR family winged helix-turn-helix transcriptional regulator n=1 Tax=Falsiroseomonas tokyonensis TaxID=430521 RepID=A0ABV7BXN7_9PROT|nr:MarR family transcriptional regulator [Falsiroseomonas tokyonensis]MBU8540201.1 MarR family transcriptional regulator [Falsiroseomonas tokyonensis]